MSHTDSSGGTPPASSVSSESSSVSSRPPTPDSVRKLRSLLRGNLRITILDGRIFIGTFVGTDKQLNVLLVNADEYRLGEEYVGGRMDGRFVGQVMIPWRLVQKVEAATGRAVVAQRSEEDEDDDNLYS